jgi:signal transduction histidine kinase
MIKFRSPIYWEKKFNGRLSVLCQTCGSRYDTTFKKFERSKIQEELTDQNNELEQFAALIAHDLKAPLNNISGFGQFLKSKLESKDDRESIELAEHIELGVHRMSQMITELLNYARLSRHERTLVPINLTDTLRKVMKDFELAIAQSDAQVNVSHLPTVMGNPVQIEHLMHNILGNAIKYRHADRRPAIEIFENTQIKIDGHFCGITIQDNGRGFPESSAEQMFQPFKRLSSAGDTEGSGFGLALCKKIVRRHHGTIMAENVKSGGARFTVTLPRA